METKPAPELTSRRGRGRPTGPAQTDDSWKNPIRMLYEVTIEFNTPVGVRTDRFQVANFHNAEAIQLAFAGVSTITVTIEPKVFAYLAKAHPHLLCDLNLVRDSEAS